MGSCVALLALLLLVVGGTAAATCPSGDCSCVAFQPLSRTLTCTHGCSEENYGVYWNLYRGQPTYNITFWFDGSRRYESHLTANPVSTIAQHMWATEDGQLFIETVSIHVHEALYTCWAQRSDGTQCGTTDSIDLTVVSLFTDTTEKPNLVDDDDYNAIYGSQRVVCMDGTTPGISEGSWEKEGVTVENAKNVSAECPNCFECPVVNIETFLTLPSVRERLEQGYSHSAFFISTSHVKVENRDYSDCLDIKNTYVTFLVIREVQPEDYGGWEVRVVSAYNVQQSAVYTIGASYKQIDTQIEPMEDVDLTSTENGYVVCNATHTINFDSNLHWKIQHQEKSVVALSNATVFQSPPRDTNLTFGTVTIDTGTLGRLCERYGHMLDREKVAFSLDYAPDSVLQHNSEEHNRALVQRRLLVLIMCNVGGEQIGTYSCIAPAQDSVARSEQSLDVHIFAPPNTTGTTQHGWNHPEPSNTAGTTQVDVGPIVGVVGVALVIISPP